MATAALSFYRPVVERAVRESLRIFSGRNWVDAIAVVVIGGVVLLLLGEAPWEDVRNGLATIGALCLGLLAVQHARAPWALLHERQEAAEARETELKQETASIRDAAKAREAELEAVLAVCRTERDRLTASLSARRVAQEVRQQLRDMIESTHRVFHRFVDMEYNTARAEQTLDTWEAQVREVLAAHGHANLVAQFEPPVPDVLYPPPESVSMPEAEPLARRFYSRARNLERLLEGPLDPRHID